eukprot:jgi/Chlat1/5931/Chrsp4S06258
MAGVGGERRVLHLTDDDILRDRYKYYAVTYVLSCAGSPKEPKYQLRPEFKAARAWLQADMCHYLTPQAADQFLHLLEYFGKPPPDLSRTRDKYLADFCSWNEQHAVYKKDLARSVNPPVQESHFADGPSAAGNEAQSQPSTRNGVDVERSSGTAATVLPGTEAAPTPQEQEAEMLTDQLMQLVASEAVLKKQLEELAASTQAKQQALEEGKRQLLEEQEKLEKDYAEREAVLQRRKHQIALELSELAAAQTQAPQVHVDDHISQQVNSSIGAGGVEAHKADAADWEGAVSIASDSEEDVPLIQRRCVRADTINLDKDAPPDPADRHSPESHKRRSPASSNSHIDNTPSAPLPKKRRVNRKKAQCYMAKRYAERVPDKRASSEFFRKLQLDKCTVLSRARDKRVDLRSTGGRTWRMDLYWSYNPSARAAELFDESEHAEAEARWEAKHKKEYYSIGKTAMLNNIAEFQKVRGKYAKALGVSASRPKAQQNTYKDVPRAEVPT